MGGTKNEQKKENLVHCDGNFLCGYVLFLAMPAGTAITDKIEPHILGLPHYQAWILYGSLLMAVGLIVWFLVECKIEDSEEEEDKHAN